MNDTIIYIYILLNIFLLKMYYLYLHDYINKYFKIYFYILF